jgi:glycosyltransferase involved in cell wall biosynthesis
MFAELNLFDKFFIRCVDHFIYISRAIAEDCMTQGIPPAKGKVVHNAVDLHEFLQPYDVTSVRNEFGWSSAEHLVGVVGRLDWWKGHEYFLKAIAQASQQNPHLRGLIIGQPETSLHNQLYFQELQALTLSLGLKDKVVFTGFREDVPRLMAALDVVVLSSAEPEPFGRVVIEGMAAAKPVVATAAGGVLDIITDRIDGLLVPGKDAPALARAILWLLSNKEQAEQMGRAARQRVTEKFTVPYQVGVIQKVYDTILNPTQDCLLPAEFKGIQ